MGRLAEGGGCVSADQKILYAEALFCLLREQVGDERYGGARGGRRSMKKDGEARGG